MRDMSSQQLFVLDHYCRLSFSLAVLIACMVHTMPAYFTAAEILDLDFCKNQVVGSENYRIHPEYSTFVNDVALIEMLMRIEFSCKFSILFAFDYIFFFFFFKKIDHVQPLILPTSENSLNNYEDHVLVMASWGFYSNENVLSYKLRSAEMETISSTECTKIYGPPFITSSVICSKDSHCSGDSGSMLVDEISYGKFVTVGVASFREIVRRAKQKRRCS